MPRTSRLHRTGFRLAFGAAPTRGRARPPRPNECALVRLRPVAFRAVRRERRVSCRAQYSLFFIHTRAARDRSRACPLPTPRPAGPPCRAHALAAFPEKVLDGAFVPEPPVVVRDQVLRLAPRAPNDHHAVLVGLPGETFRRARPAHAARKHHVQVLPGIHGRRVGALEVLDARLVVSRLGRPAPRRGEASRGERGTNARRRTRRSARPDVWGSLAARARGARVSTDGSVRA